MQEDTMVLEHEITLVGQKGSRACRALFDSGSSYSIVRDDIAREIAVLNPLPDPENWVFETAAAGQTMQALDIVPLVFRFADSEAHFSDEIVVLKDLTEEVIIGALTMQKWQIKLDFDKEEVIYRKTAQRLRI
jgi:hypothetical protein